MTALVTNSNNFANASAFYAAIFSEVFQGDSLHADNYVKYCKVDSQVGTSYEFDFLSSFPFFRKWLGPKVSKSTRANKYRIPVEKYEATTTVEQVYFNQQPTLVGAQIRTWMGAARGLINKLVIDTLVTGNSVLGYDGVAFFGTTHPLDDGNTQSNYSTTALSQTAYRAAATAMMAFTDSVGRPLGIVPRKLLVGPANAYIARDILEAKSRTQGITAAGLLDASSAVVAAAGIDNVVSNDGVELIVDNFLTGTAANYWFLIGEAADGKPMIVNIARAPEPKDNTTQYIQGSPTYDFSIEAELAVGFGLWQYAIGNFAS